MKGRARKTGFTTTKLYIFTTLCAYAQSEQEKTRLLCTRDTARLQKFDGENFNLRKLGDLEVGKEYRLEITNRFSTLENVNDDEDINRAWESINKNIKTSAKESLGLHEMKQHKPWFDEECLGILDQRKQAKIQWCRIQTKAI
jgi:hypothetical protein